MARIRTIKPEFCQSESIGNISRDARLLFILIWTHVDDEGRARAASRMLASVLFPYDDDAPKMIGNWLDELEEQSLIKRYEVEGSRYLEVVNWLKHQKIDHPSKSKIPPSSDNSRKPRASVAKPRENSRNLAPDLGPSTKDLGPEDSVLSDGGDQPAASLPVEGEILDPEPVDPQKRLFETGKAVLASGPKPNRNGGGLIANLLRAHGGDVAAAQERVDRAARAQDPAEFLAGCIKSAAGPPRHRPDPYIDAARKLMDRLNASAH